MQPNQPSLADIKVVHFTTLNTGNPAMVVRLRDGTIIDAMRQGGMDLWAFPKRPNYTREWHALFDRRMNELWAAIQEDDWTDYAPSCDPYAAQDELAIDGCFDRLRNWTPDAAQRAKDWVWDELTKAAKMHDDHAETFDRIKRKLTAMVEQDFTK